MFGPRYGYGYAGGAFGRLLSFLCPMLLLLETLAIVVGLPPTIVRWLWIGLIATLALSAVAALALLLLGPWRNRFAGVWLAIVAGGTWWLSGPVNAWAGQLSRYF